MPDQADAMSLGDVWIVIEGHDRNLRSQWEMTRSLAFTMALYGQSDKKKLRSAQKFWPFPWDKEEDKGSKYKAIMEQHLKNKAIRETLQKQKS